jgi:hypothetical protein
MKTLILVALLLAQASSSSAYTATAAIWDCGNGAKVIEDDGKFGVFTRHPGEPGEADMANHGAIRLDLKWDFRGNEARVWLNGKRCSLVIT